MTSDYYKPCRELTICDELIEKYYKSQEYEKCFEGHMALAKEGYPLAECQIGYFYWAGLGVTKNQEQAFRWTEKAAVHGDRDAQFNLGKFYEEGYFASIDRVKALEWYTAAAVQNHDMAIEKCRSLKAVAIKEKD